jgi:hypothetical protein
MDNSTEALVTSGLNAVTMVTFAIPGGAPVGIALSAGTFLFEIFFPPVQPPAHPVTFSELRAALDSLKTELIDAIWQGKADDINDRVLALFQGFTEVSDAMKKLQVDGKAYVPSATNDTIRYFTAHTYEYFNLQDPNGALTKLRSFRNVLEGHSLNDTELTQTQLAEHKTRTIGLYGLIGCLTTSYLNAAVIWKWGRELLVAYQYQQYQAALAQWKDDNGKDPTAMDRREIARKYPGVSTNPHYKPPAWNDWIKQANCPVPRLIGEVQLMVDYCVGTDANPGLYTTMNNTLDELEKHAADGDVALVPNQGITIAQMKLAFLAGAARCNWLSYEDALYGLERVAENDIDLFGQAIQVWQTTAAGVSFTTYTVHSWEKTLGDVVSSLPPWGPRGMPPGYYATYIYAWNKEITYSAQSLASGDELKYEPAPGSTLKLFDPRVLKFI